MSDQPMGPGWWMASDGKWYPPELHPDAAAASPPVSPTEPIALAPFGLPPGPSGPAPGGERHVGRIIAIVAVVLLAVGGVAVVVTRGDTSKKASTDRSESVDTVGSDSTSESDSSRSESSVPLSVDAPAGYKAYTDDASGFALALPESYDTADLSKGDIDNIITTLKEANPKLAAVMETFRSSFQQGIKLFAYDTQAAGRFADNINIVQSPLPLDPTAPFFLEQVKQQLTSIGATDLTTSTRSLRHGEGAVASFTLPVKTPNGTSISVHGEQGYVKAGGELWVLSASTIGGTDPFDVALETFVAG